MEPTTIERMRDALDKNYYDLAIVLADAANAEAAERQADEQAGIRAALERIASVLEDWTGEEDHAIRTLVLR